VNEESTYYKQMNKSVCSALDLEILTSCFNITWRFVGELFNKLECSLFREFQIYCWLHRL